MTELWTATGFRVAPDSGSLGTFHITDLLSRKHWIFRQLSESTGESKALHTQDAKSASYKYTLSCQSLDFSRLDFGDFVTTVCSALSEEGDPYRHRTRQTTGLWPRLFPGKSCGVDKHWRRGRILVRPKPTFMSSTLMSYECPWGTFNYREFSTQEIDSSLNRLVSEQLQILSIQPVIRWSAQKNRCSFLRLDVLTSYDLTLAPMHWFMVPWNSDWVECRVWFVIRDIYLRFLWKDELSHLYLSFSMNAGP